MLYVFQFLWEFLVASPSSAHVGTPSSSHQLMHNLAPFSVPTVEVFKEDIIVADCIVPKETANKVINGQYVNLSLLLIKDEYEDDEHLSIFKGSLKIRKRHGKPIADYDRWLEAMFNYEYFLTNFVVDKQANVRLSAYRRYIHSLQVKYKWEKVYMYDQKVRTELARRRSFAFDQPDITNFTEVFDADSLKPQPSESSTSGKKCFRCQSPSHLVTNCPFQEEAPVAAQAKNTGSEICYKYNDGNCFYQQCKRHHACIICGSQHPRIKCSVQSLSSGSTGFMHGWPNTGYPPPGSSAQSIWAPIHSSSQPLGGVRPAK